MSKFRVQILKWNEVSKEIRDANPDLHSLMDSIAQNMQGSYVYKLRLKFGEPIIENGTTIFLRKENLPEIEFEPKGFFGNSNTDLKTFIEDCGADVDHPLSLVVKNYLEIYCNHSSSYKLSGLLTEENYAFPLNIINKGDLFGVWGAVNSVFKKWNKNLYGWHAVGGKICILPLLPEELAEGKADILYRQNFSKIFPDSKGPLEGIINNINFLLNDETFTELIIIPERFYIIDKNKEKSNIEIAKLKLRDFLFCTAWEQTQVLRDMVWSDKELMLSLNKDKTDMEFYLTKHIYNIVTEKSFLLKPVDSNDGILFDSFKDLVNRFHDIKKGSKNLLNNTTPVFLHYTKLDDKNLKGIELLHTPSMNIILPKTRNEEMKDIIMYNILKQHDLEKFLKSKGYEVIIKYYKLVSSSYPNYVSHLQEYIDKELTPLYSKLLFNGPVRLPKSPKLFNSFIHIEKKTGK